MDSLESFYFCINIIFEGKFHTNVFLSFFPCPHYYIPDIELSNELLILYYTSM